MNIENSCDGIVTVTGTHPANPEGLNIDGVFMQNITHVGMYITQAESVFISNVEVFHSPEIALELRTGSDTHVTNLTALDAGTLVKILVDSKNNFTGNFDGLLSDGGNDKYTFDITNTDYAKQAVTVNVNGGIFRASHGLVSKKLDVDGNEIDGGSSAVLTITGGVYDLSHADGLLLDANTSANSRTYVSGIVGLSQKTQLVAGQMDGGVYFAGAAIGVYGDPSASLNNANARSVVVYTATV